MYVLVCDSKWDALESFLSEDEYEELVLHKWV